MGQLALEQNDTISHFNIVSVSSFIISFWGKKFNKKFSAIGNPKACGVVAFVTARATNSSA